MDDLVTFLRAALDDDERGINEWIEVPWDGLLSSPLRAVHELTGQVGAQRMRAEMAAKRAIVDQYERLLTVNSANEKAFAESTSSRSGPSSHPA